MVQTPTEDNTPASRDRSEEILPDDVAQNAGARAAAGSANPKISLEEARNAAAGEGPNGARSVAPDDSEDYVPSHESPEARDLPSAR